MIFQFLYYDNEIITGADCMLCRRTHLGALVLNSISVPNWQRRKHSARHQASRDFSATVGTVNSEDHREDDEVNSEHMEKKPVFEGGSRDTNEEFLPGEPAVTGASAAMPLKLVGK